LVDSEGSGGSTGSALGLGLEGTLVVDSSPAAGGSTPIYYSMRHVFDNVLDKFINLTVNDIISNDLNEIRSKTKERQLY
jgi:hypothetical protein